jgi:hypothetical protein
VPASRPLVVKWRPCWRPPLLSTAQRAVRAVAILKLPSLRSQTAARLSAASPIARIMAVLAPLVRLTPSCCLGRYEFPAAVALTPVMVRLCSRPSYHVRAVARFSSCRQTPAMAAARLSVLCRRFASAAGQLCVSNAGCCWAVARFQQQPSSTPAMAAARLSAAVVPAPDGRVMSVLPSTAGLLLGR